MQLDQIMIQRIWEFIRGDLPVDLFERWVYEPGDLEDRIGQQLFLDIVSVDFKSRSEVSLLKKKLEEIMLKNHTLICECITLKNLAVTDMGTEKERKLWKTLREVKSYGEERWWLALYLCDKCQQYWLVAQEPREYDIHCLKRLSSAEAQGIIQNNQWPGYFETLEDLFLIGSVNYPSL